MPANYVLLERIELAASASSITFANIPQTGYTDLKIVTSARLDAASDWSKISFNGVTTGYSYRLLQGAGSGTPGSYNASDRDFGGGNANSSSYTANTFASTEIYIPNFTSSNNKSFSIDTVQETNATTAYSGLLAYLWSNTAAINSVSLTAISGNFVANSTFSLYGLAAVGTTPTVAPKASGGNITTDGTYWIHTFNSSGYFVPQTGLSCDYLVVAGGGGGGGTGGENAGGGGAGGFLTGTGLSVTASSYTITVGSGGAGSATGAAAAGTSGTNSIFSSITSTGGGGGGSYGITGRNGGSGGGSGQSDGTGSGRNGLASPAGQGNNGGDTPNNGYSGSGGGGASAVGTNASGTNNRNAGAGGAGTSNSYSGSAVTYAGGGGGGQHSSSTNPAASGGAGGGGNGGYKTTIATAGTANLGGGGGGGCDGSGNYAGKNGGSGIVIIRYPI